MNLSRFALLLVLLPSLVLAQSSPNWVLGYKPTVAEINAQFAKKLDVTNGTFAGAVNATTLSVSGTASLNGAATVGGALTVSGNTAVNNLTIGGTPTGPTAAPGTNTTQLATTAFVTAAASAPLRGYLGGMITSRSSATVLGVTAGTATDSTGTVMITLGAFTKSTAGSWAAGTGGNGMGAGLTIAVSTWYHVYAIINGGAADVYFDTSAAAANKPTGTTAFRRIGSFKTDGSAQIVAFVQNGDEFLWATTVRDVASAVPLTTAVLATLSVPTGVQTTALYRAAYGDSAGASGVLFTSLSETDQAVSLTGPGASLESPQASGTFAAAGQFQTRANTSAQIRYRASVTTTNVLNIATYGWLDTRGRFD